MACNISQHKRHLKRRPDYRPGLKSKANATAPAEKIMTASVRNKQTTSRRLPINGVIERAPLSTLSPQWRWLVRADEPIRRLRLVLSPRLTLAREAFRTTGHRTPCAVDRARGVCCRRALRCPGTRGFHPLWQVRYARLLEAHCCRLPKVCSCVPGNGEQEAAGWIGRIPDSHDGGTNPGIGTD